MAWRTAYTVYDLTEAPGLLLDQLRATLWEVYSTLEPGDVIRRHVDELQTVQPAGGALSFQWGPTALPPETRDICLSVRVQGEPGLCVRTGRLSSLPTSGASSPTPQLDLVLPPPTEAATIPPADRDLVIALNAGAGSGSPFGTFQSMSLGALPGTATATIVGTSEVANKGTPFTFALELDISSRTDVTLPTQLVAASAPGAGVLTFGGPAPSQSRQDEMRAALLQFAVPRVALALDTALGPLALAAARTALRNAFGREPGNMPASALVSARRTVVGTDAIAMLPCVADFDLVSTLLPPQQGSGCMGAPTALAGRALTRLARRRPSG